MSVLYRKYRPKTFAEVAGQEHVKAALVNEIAAQRVAHSYLFSGPRGVGKTSLARILAKALSCGARTAAGEPCGSCDTCMEIAEGRALDVVEIDAASHTGVDNVREQIIENARFAPSKLAYKVFIIDEVHMLSTSAFNALLKTLEEPPPHAVFVLATTELHKLPATVISRCQRFEFRKIPAAELRGRLAALAEKEGYRVDPSVLETIVLLSEGCLRDAESLLSQVFALGEKDIGPETAARVLPMLSAESLGGLMAALEARAAPKALAAWEALLEAGADPARITGTLIESARAAAIAAMKNGGVGLDGISALLERLVRAHGEMKRLDPPELAFELLLAEWCAPARAALEPPRLKTAAPGATKAEPGSLRHEPQPESAPASKEGTSVEAAPEMLLVAAATAPAQDMPLEAIKEKWKDVLAAAQKRDHGLPYMLAAAELVESSNGMLTVGFQYAMYRDRLNAARHRENFEAALGEALGAPFRVKTVLVARAPEAAEAAPPAGSEAATSLPEGFSDLVKEFGGTIA